MKKTLTIILLLILVNTLLSSHEVYLGNPDSSEYSHLTPLFLNYESTLSQTIFLEEEIGSYGLINSIKYTINSNGYFVDPFMVKVFIGTTTQSSFYGDYSQLPMSTFTEVFFGPMDISATGIYDVEFPFTEPFIYEGGNLAIMVFKPRTLQYNFYNTWHFTPTTGPTLSFYAYDIHFEIDPNYIQHHVKLAGRANVRLVFQTEGLGTLSGIVTHNGLPLEDVDILIVGTERTYKTNSEGQYTIESIPEGLISISASKHMYLTEIIEDILIEEDTITTLDIEMNLKQYDLAAISLTGTQWPVLGFNNKYVFEIANEGSDTFNGADYHVELLDFETGTVLTTIDGVTLLSNASHSFTFQWKPSYFMAENKSYMPSIFAQIVSDVDQSLYNNFSNTILITMQPEGQGYAYIGDINSTVYSSSVPISYYESASVSQTIYLEEEIHANGLLTHISYDFIGSGDILPTHQIMIYMATTEETEFSSADAWIPFEDFTLVYTGALPVSQNGNYAVNIALDEHYAYEGDNLVIMTHRLLGGYYFISNRWQVTVHPDTYRSMYLRNAYVDYDLSDLPDATEWDGAMSFQVPNIELHFTVGETGILTGVVSYEGNPLSDALVVVNGTSRIAFSNELGEYTITYVPAGIVEISAFKHGFEDKIIGNIHIEPDEINIQNIEMTALTSVTVSGKVIASNTGLGLEGAKIKLDGYSTYENITTDAEGMFIIPGVYVDNIYTLTINREKYFTYVDENISVGNTNLVLEDIVLYERANRPRNLVAARFQDSETMQLNWSPPVDTHDIWFSHTQSEEGSFNVGTEDPFVYSVAHRYSVEQLHELGLTDGKLTKLLIMPGIPTALYSIRVWIGGSTDPYNSGTLVYSGAVMPGSELILEDWNEIELSYPITVPSDAELWIGYNISTIYGGNAAVADAGPALEGYTNLICFNDTWNRLTELVPHMSYNWLIRGFVEEAIHGGYGRKKQDTALVYNIYRIESDDETVKETIASNIQETHYNDPTWDSVQDGAYMYTVEAVYTHDNVSEPAFSNVVSKNMFTNVTLNIIGYGAENDGSIISLINNNGKPGYEHHYTTALNDETFVFQNVWNGTYTLTITHPSFLVYTDLNFEVNSSNSTKSITLLYKEVLFVEGFEDTTFPPNDWILIDADTDGYNWSNAFPISAHSGTKVAASESFRNNVGILNPDNYLITPAINIPYEEAAYLTYYIAIQDPMNPADTYSVMISTTTPTIDRFVTIHQETLSMSNAFWQKRYIDLTAYIGSTIHIAFRHHDSADNFMLKIDDVEIINSAWRGNISENPVLPLVTTLQPNYPNPFNPSTTIRFDKAIDGNVRIDIYNIRGQRVHTLADEHFPAGNHWLEWHGVDSNGRNVASGVYFLRMQTNEYSATRRMVLMK